MHFLLQWRHNETDGVSNHQPRDCLLNSLFMHRSKKTSKLRVIGLCAGNSPVTGEFPAQRANNAENVSIWWRHHERCWKITAGPWSVCHGNMQKFVHLVMGLWCRTLIEQIVSIWWDTLPSHNKTTSAITGHDMKSDCSISWCARVSILLDGSGVCLYLTAWAVEFSTICRYLISVMMTSHERHIISNLRSFDCLGNSLWGWGGGVWGWGVGMGWVGGGWGGGEFIGDTVSSRWIYLVLQKRLLYPLNHFPTTYCVLLKMRWLSTEIGLNVLNRQLLSDSAIPKHHVNCFATHDLPELFTSRWRHNERDGVSNHQPHDCLLNRLFRRRTKKTSKLRVTGLCAGNSPGTGEFPAQMASDTENVSIWWRHNEVFMHARLKSPLPWSYWFPASSAAREDNFFKMTFPFQWGLIQYGDLRQVDDFRKANAARLSFKMTSSNGNFFRVIVRGIHQWPVTSPHKGRWRRALMFSVICARTNGWVNNRHAGDSILHRAQYDLTVMFALHYHYRCYRHLRVIDHVRLGVWSPPSSLSWS